MIHLEVERSIAELHKAGRLDDSVFDALVPDGEPLNFEGFQFDYKSFVKEEDQKASEDHVVDLIRDISAF